MRGIQSRLYIVEGEIEENFIKFLISHDFIRPGKVRVFNLMQQEIKPTNNILTKQHDKVFCIIDTDRVEPACIQKLYNNYKTLCQCNSSVRIIPQSHNFEDELARMIGKKELHSILGIAHAGKQNLKRNLSTYHYDKVIKTFPLHYCSDIDTISAIIKQNGYSMRKDALAAGIALTK